MVPSRFNHRGDHMCCLLVQSLYVQVQDQPAPHAGQRQGDSQSLIRIPLPEAVDTVSHDPCIWHMMQFKKLKVDSPTRQRLEKAAELFAQVCHAAHASTVAHHACGGKHDIYGAGQRASDALKALQVRRQQLCNRIYRFISECVLRAQINHPPESRRPPSRPSPCMSARSLGPPRAHEVDSRPHA